MSVTVQPRAFEIDAVPTDRLLVAEYHTLPPGQRGDRESPPITHPEWYTSSHYADGGASNVTRRVDGACVSFTRAEIVAELAKRAAPAKPAPPTLADLPDDLWAWVEYCTRGREGAQPPITSLETQRAWAWEVGRTALRPGAWVQRRADGAELTLTHSGIETEMARRSAPPADTRPAKHDVPAEPAEPAPLTLVDVPDAVVAACATWATTYPHRWGDTDAEFDAAVAAGRAVGISFHATVDGHFKFAHRDGRELALPLMDLPWEHARRRLRAALPGLTTAATVPESPRALEDASVVAPAPECAPAADGAPSTWTFRRAEPGEFATTTTGASTMMDDGLGVLGAVGAEFSAVGMRTARKQYTALAREAATALLLNLFGPADAEGMRARIAAFLDTDAGEAVLQGLSSAALMWAPGEGAAARFATALATELRQEAEATGAHRLLETFMAPLRQAALTYATALTKPAEIAAAISPTITPLEERTGVRASAPAIETHGDPAEIARAVGSELGARGAK